MSAVAEAPVVQLAAPRAPWRATVARTLRGGRGRVGVGLTLAIVAIALLGPLLAPYAPDKIIGTPFAAPGGDALLGTDALGRDVFSRWLWGGRTVVWMSLAATLIGVSLGVALGLLAGYGRGWLDELIMRGNDVILAFPPIVLALLFVSVLGPSEWLIVLVVSASHWPSVARVARGATLEQRDREFVQAAEVLGVPRRRILLREILPNITSPLMVELGLRLTWSIGLIAAISFVGFGIQPPAADWGLMVNENRNALTLQPWPVLLPILSIALFTIGTNLIAEGFARAMARTDGAGGAS